MAVTAVPRESDARLNAVQMMLDQIQIPQGTLLSRLQHLVDRDRTIRASLSDAMQSRIEAIEKLTQLNRQLSLPAGAEGPIAEAIKQHNTRLQIEIEKVVAALATMEPDYLHVEVVKELVMTSQQLLDSTSAFIYQRRDGFVKGDPLVKSVNNDIAEVSLALAAIRAKRAYGDKS